MRFAVLIACIVIILPIGAGESRSATAAHLLKVGRNAEALAECTSAAAKRSDPDIEILRARAAMRGGDAATAIAALGRAVGFGFADPDSLAGEVDFVPLRSSATFAFIQKAATAQAGRAAMWKAVDMPGLRTLHSPPGAPLPWRLRLPPGADADHRARLLVWLHPSGAAALEAAEALARPLADAGWALLVFTAKDWRGWSDADVRGMLRAVTHVSTMPELDASMPALWGFSAGGQVALSLHRRKPTAWSALVIGSAYPVGPREQGFPLLPPPPGTQIGGARLFVVSGGKDPLTGRWSEADPVWTAAGIPIEIRVIEGLGHADWPFQGPVAKDMVRFLASIPPTPPSLPATAAPPATPVP